MISGVALRVANQISGVASATPGPFSEHTPVGNVGFQAQAEIIYFFQIFGKFLHQRHYWTIFTGLTELLVTNKLTGGVAF